MHLPRTRYALLVSLLAMGFAACDTGDPEVVQAAENLCDSVAAAGEPQRALDEGLADAERAGHFRSAMLQEMEEHCPEALQGLDRGREEMAQAVADFEVVVDECRQHRAGGTVHNASSETRDVRIVVEFLDDGGTQLARVRTEVSELGPGEDGHWEARSGIRAGAEDCAASVEGVR